MSDPVRNLTLDKLRQNRARPTVNRPVDSLATPTTPAESEASVTPTTPTTPATPATPVESAESEASVTPTTPTTESLSVMQPVKQVRRTLRLDADANEHVKSMLGMGCGGVNIDVLVEAMLMFTAEQPEEVQASVIEVAKARAVKRRERSQKLREQKRLNNAG